MERGGVVIIKRLGRRCAENGTMKKILKCIEITVFLKNASIIEKKRKFIGGVGVDREKDE